jgi:hypothetical protein
MLCPRHGYVLASDAGCRLMTSADRRAEQFVYVTAALAKNFAVTDENGCPQFMQMKTYHFENEDICRRH